jgi:ABC-2 type transport system ATP-binding protein
VADPFIIETTELRKSYDGVDAIRGLNLQVPAGSICGFLGRNGAGKTTTIKVLLGMARPTSGQARVFGLAADTQETSLDIRRRTGFVSDDKDLYGYMTVEEMIRFTAAFFPRWRGRSGAALSPRVRIARGPEGQGSLARHAHQTRLAAGALPGRGTTHTR